MLENLFRVAINLKEDSEAEDYFMRAVMPKLENGCGVELGAICGHPGVNRYSVSLLDWIRTRKEMRVVRALKRL